MRKLILVLAVVGSLFLGSVKSPEPADAHIDWSTPFDICHFTVTVFHEVITGTQWNVVRATNFNLFGHFGVGCTVYEARTYPNQVYSCFVYDRHTHEVFGVNCPTP